MEEPEETGERAAPSRGARGRRARPPRTASSAAAPRARRPRRAAGAGTIRRASAARRSTPATPSRGTSCCTRWRTRRPARRSRMRALPARSGRVRAENSVMSAGASITATPTRPRAAETAVRRVRGSSGSIAVCEEADEDRKRREEDGREARLDPLLREKDARVVDADLQQAAPGDAQAHAAPSFARPAREGKRRDQNARQRHPDAAEPERRQVPQADLDDQPRRAPHGADADVHRQPAAGEDGHGGIVYG